MAPLKRISQAKKNGNFSLEKQTERKYLQHIKQNKS